MSCLKLLIVPPGRSGSERVDSQPGGQSKQYHAPCHGRRGNSRYISSTHKIKGRHDGELGIVVAKKYQSQGIGSELIRRLIEWARGNGVTTRLSLDTRTDNVNAVSLYLKFGFQVEGCRLNSTLLDGKYYDLYVMGMML